MRVLLDLRVIVPNPDLCNYSEKYIHEIIIRYILNTNNWEINKTKGGDTIYHKHMQC